ncbi:hypothetical protein DAPPUDRAFT_339738, partial [Daphnia pulex]
MRLFDKSPEIAVDLMSRLWLPTAEGATRCLNVLATATHLGCAAHEMLLGLIPHVLEDETYVVPVLVKKLAADSHERAADFYVECMAAQTERSLKGLASRHFGRAEEVLKLDVDPSSLLDRVEPIYLRIATRTREVYDGQLNDWEEIVRDVVERLLSELGEGAAAPALLNRANTLPPQSVLEPLYLRSLVRLTDYAALAASWVAAVPSRLEHDPESCRFLEVVAVRLGESETQLIDTAIDAVNRYDTSRRDDAEWRMRRLKCNRSYRMYLRSLLIQEYRRMGRRAFDEGERHQVLEFEPDRGIRGGFVQSPMSVVQLELA